MMARSGLPDIGVLLEQAMAASYREATRSGQAGPAAEAMATAGHPDISVLIEEALAASRRQATRGDHSAHVVADAGEATGGEMGLGQSIGADARRESEGREMSRVHEQSAVRAGEVGVT